MANQQGGGLPKKIVDIGLTAGVNKKRDSHQLQNGELLTAENVIFTNVDGQICKRNGFAPVTPQGAAFQGGPFKAIGCRDGVEPLVLGQNTLNRYNAATNLSTALATPTQARLELQQIAGSSGKQSDPWPPSHASCATDGSSYIAVTWCEPSSSGAVMFYGVQDLVTGNWIISPQVYPAFATPTVTSGTLTYTQLYQCEPMVQYNNGYFWFFWQWTGVNSTNSPSVYAHSILSATLQLTNLSAGLVRNGLTFNCQNSVASVAYPSGAFAFDVHMSNNTFIVAWVTATNYQAQFQYGTITGNTGVASSNVGGFANNTSNGNIRIACRCDGPSSSPFVVANNFQCQIYSSNGTSIAVYGLSTGAAARVTPGTVDVCWVNGKMVWTTTQNFGTSSVIAKTGPYVLVLNPGSPITVAATITPNTPVNTFYGELLSRNFTQAVANKVYFWYGLASTSSDSLYNSAFLYEVDTSTSASQIVARTLYTSNFHITGNDRLRPCEVVKVPSSQRYVSMLTAGAERVATSTWQAYGTLCRTLIDFAPARQPQMLALPTGGVLIAGGYPLYYDGNDVVEAGFSSPPSSDAMTQSAFATKDANVRDFGRFYITGDNTAGGIGLVGGTNTQNASGYIEYYYVLCFVRRDSYGNVYRSAPSSVITVPAQYLNTQVVFPGYTSNAGGNVNVEIYRSKQATPGTYYKIAVVPMGTSYTDIQPDKTTNAQGRVTFDLAASPTIYTNSGELPNDPPPPCHHVVLSEQRAFMIPADNRNVVWYSKQFSPGRTVEWCANLTMSEGLNSGAFEGLAVMDSFLIVFKKNSILYTTGNGPDNTGSNGSFAPFQKIATDVGCIEAASIQVIPDGVVFKSYRGIELLTRGLSLTYIGNNVENLVALNGPLSSIVLMPNFNELRFIPANATRTITNPDGTTYTYSPCVLTYDYQGKRWSTQTNMAATQAININNDYWWISADGTLVNKETPGKYLDNGTAITMTLETPEIPVGSGGSQGWGRAYRMALLGDFFSAHSLKLQFAYDHSPTYTDAVTFNTSSGLISGESIEQFRLSRLPRSTMQTLRIKIQDTNQSGTAQSCAISDLVLEVGDKSGLARLPGIKTL